MFYIFILISVALVLILLLIYFCRKRDVSLPIIDEFIRKRYLKSRFKIWDDIARCEQLEKKKKDQGFCCRFCFKFHKLQSTIYYYLAIIFKSSRESFLLLNCDYAEKCEDEDYPKHLAKQRKISTFSIYVLFLLIIANVSTGLIASYIFPNIFGIHAANQVVHNSLTDWQGGTADSGIDYSSGAVKLKIGSSTTMDSFVDFEHGEASSSEISINSGFIQPKQSADPQWVNENVVASNVDLPSNDLAIAPGNNGSVFFAWKGSNTNNMAAGIVDADGASTAVADVSTNGDSSKSSPAMLADGGGGVYVVWPDERNHESTGWDLYLQTINAGGQTMGSEAGVVTKPGNQNDLALASTSNFLIIVYEDDRDYDTNGRDVYATLINLHTYQITELPIATSSNDQLDLKIITTSDDGAIIAWRDKRDDNLNIYAQKIDSAGNLVWPANGRAIVEPVELAGSIDEDIDGNFNIISDNNGGAFLNYEKGNNALFNFSNYAVRINSAGDVPAEWGAGKLLGLHYSRLGSMVLDNDNNLFITWSDFRYFFADPVILAQKMDGNGNFLWDHESLVGDSFSFFSSSVTPQAFLFNDGFITSWISYPVSFNLARNVYIQKTNTDGQSEFAAFGKALTNIPVDDIDHQITYSYPLKTSDDSLIVFYQKDDDNNLYAQKISNEIKYEEQSSYTSPVLDLNDASWENISWLGDTDNVRIETRTSNNLSLGATATASSEMINGAFFSAGGNTYASEMNCPATNANDGLTSFNGFGYNSEWASLPEGGVCATASSTAWLEMDYGATTTVGYVRSLAGGVNMGLFAVSLMATESTIQTWDGSNWIVQATSTLDLEHPLNSEVSFGPVETTKIRYAGVSTGLLGVIGLSEFETYASPDDVWSDWEPISDAGKILSPEKRFLQYRVVMDIASNTLPEDIPMVDSITVDTIPDWVTTGIPPVYTSSVIDSGFGNYGTTWQTIEIEKDVPEGTDIAWATRSGQTATPDSSWSDWATTTTENISSPNARYFQYRMALSSDDADTTPAVNSVTVNFDPAVGAGEPSENEETQSIPGSSGCFSFSGYDDFSAGTSGAGISLSTDSGILSLQNYYYGWAENGLSLTTNPGDKVDQQIISDGAGGFLVAYQDKVEDDGDIYMQSIDDEGTADNWGDYGYAIVYENNTQSQLKLVPNGNTGESYLVWQDNRNGNNDIFAQRVYSGGSNAWTWQGVGVSTNASDQKNPQPLYMSNSGLYFVSWEDNRNGTYDLYGNVMDSSGNVILPEDLAIATSSGNISNHHVLYSSSDGSTILVWQGDSSGTSDIYAKKLDSNGAVYSGWDEAGVLVCGAEGDQREPQIVSDGNGGVIVSWQDERDTGTNDIDIYAEHLDADGVAQWNPGSGIPVSATTGNQYLPKMVTDGNNGAYIVWEDGRHDSEGTDSDIYFQHVGSDGGMEFNEAGEENGRIVTTAHSTQYHPSIIKDDSDNVFIVWEDWRDDIIGRMYAQKFNSSGTALWPENGVVLTSDTNQATDFQLALDTSGNVGVVYSSVSEGGVITPKIQKILASPQHVSTGTYTSSLIDAGETVSWLSFDGVMTTTTDTSIVISTRTVDADESASVNLSIDATATSSTPFNPGLLLGPELAIDGSEEFSPPSSYSTWASDPSSGMPAWLEVDYSLAKTVGSVVIKSLSSGGLNAFPYDYVIQTWNGSGWDDQVTTTANTSLNKIEIFPAPVSTEKVRIWITAANPELTGDYENLVGITEFETYASAPPVWSDWQEVSGNLIQSPQNRYLQWKATLSTEDVSVTPDLSSVEFCYSARPSTQLIEYAIVDSNSASTTWLSLYASTTIPLGTSIDWATRSGDTPDPDGIWDDWATTTYAISDQHGRYLQYRALLSTSNVLVTPEIHSVVVRYLTSEEGEQEEEDNPPEEYTIAGTPGTSPVPVPVIKTFEGNFSCSITPAVTTSQKVNVKLNGGQSALFMAISENPSFLPSSLSYYQDNYDYQLSSGFGMKTLYVKFLNDEGTPSRTISCQVELRDIEKPVNEVKPSDETKKPDEVKDKNDDIVEPEKPAEETKVDENNTAADANTIEAAGETAGDGEQRGGPTAGTVGESTKSEDYPVLIEITKNVNPGENDIEIKVLKGILVVLGYLPADTDISNNFFDQITRDAVIAFQKDHGIDPIGVVGPKTRLALNQAYASSLPQIIAPIPETGADTEKASSSIDQENPKVQDYNIKKTNQTLDRLYQFAGKIREEAASSTSLAVTTTGLAVGYIGISVLQVAGQVNSFSQIPYMFFNLFGLLAYRKKRRAGAVYDADTGQPVSLARVTIFDKKTGQAKETKVTDKNGSYYFLVPAGQYYLKAEKKGYKLLSKAESQEAKTVYSQAYAKNEVIEFEKEDIVSKNLPIQNIQSSKLNNFFAKPLVSKILAVLFVAGLFSSIFLTVIRPSVTNYVITLLYVTLAFLKYANFSHPRWGIVSLMSGVTQPFTMVEATDAKDKEFFGRTVADEHGRYAFILDQGNYLLQARSVSGQSVKEKLIVKGKRIIAGRNIKMK
jgi:hypothetical protein